MGLRVDLACGVASGKTRALLSAAKTGTWVAGAPAATRSSLKRFQEKVCAVFRLESATKQKHGARLVIEDH